jgi:hypothetical protein
MCEGGRKAAVIAALYLPDVVLMKAARLSPATQCILAFTAFFDVDLDVNKFPRPPLHGYVVVGRMRAPICAHARAHTRAHTHTLLPFNDHLWSRYSGNSRSRTSNSRYATVTLCLLSPAVDVLCPPPSPQPPLLALSSHSNLCPHTPARPSRIFNVCLVFFLNLPSESLP